LFLKWHFVLPEDGKLVPQAVRNMPWI